jgi:hypothetical protein
VAHQWRAAPLLRLDLRFSRHQLLPDSGSLAAHSGALSLSIDRANLRRGWQMPHSAKVVRCRDSGALVAHVEGISRPWARCLPLGWRPLAHATMTPAGREWLPQPAPSERLTGQARGSRTRSPDRLIKRLPALWPEVWYSLLQAHQGLAQPARSRGAPYKAAPLAGYTAPSCVHLRSTNACEHGAKTASRVNVARTGRRFW